MANHQCVWLNSLGKIQQQKKKLNSHFFCFLFLPFCSKKKIENFNFVLYHHTHLAGKTGWLYSTELMWCVEYKFLIELFFMIFWLQCTWVYEKEEKKKFLIYIMYICVVACVCTSSWAKGKVFHPLEHLQAIQWIFYNGKIINFQSGFS